jgi:hypothetical protein
MTSDMSKFSAISVFSLHEFLFKSFAHVLNQVVHLSLDFRKLALEKQNKGEKKQNKKARPHPKNI